MKDLIRLGLMLLGQNEDTEFEDVEYDGEDYDDLDLDESDIDELEDSASGVERSANGNEITFGKKMCPTRHGCTGAASCNYAYADYPD